MYTYWRLEIKNKGRKAALNCTPTLSLHGVQPQDVMCGIVSSSSNPPILINWGAGVCWSCIGNPPTFTIHPGGGGAGVDIYRVHHPLQPDPDSGARIPPEEAAIEIPTENGWKPLRAKLKIKPYNGTVSVSAENHKPIQRKIQLLSNENGDVKLHLVPSRPWWRRLFRLS
ncbi:MAG: hypothetical protein HYU86_07065 [Chloroflexi bacterium]|nr:hypothetical protein [Chloroflexota bacterium]